MGHHEPDAEIQRYTKDPSLLVELCREVIERRADELEDLLKDLKARMGRTSAVVSGKKPRTKKDKSPKTNRTVLRKLIIEGLIQLGGSAQKKDLYKRMEKNYEGTSNRDCTA